MTDPEVSKQFIRYPVQIQEALHTTNLTAYESRIIHYIIRKTFGWNKTTDQISQRQIANATGIDRRTVRKVLQRLKDRKIILNKPYKKGGRYRSATLGINPNVNQWLRVGAPQPPPKVGAEIVQGGRSDAPKSGRSSTPYNRKYILTTESGDASLANGKSQEESPSVMSKEQAQKGKARIQELLDFIG